MGERLTEPELNAPRHILEAAGQDMELPPGYEAKSIARGGQLGKGPGPGRLLHNGRTLIFRSDLGDKIIRSGIWDPEQLLAGPLVADWIEGGRTRHALVETEGESWVLKAYRRGGVVGLLNSARYWGARRFIQELEVASTAQRMGVATAEVLAIVLESAGFGSLRAWLVSRYLPGVRPLYHFFGDRHEVALFRAAGELVARMHAAAIDHPDLHLGNIVGAHDGNEPSTYIIDWDRASRHPVGSWNPYANLIRLWRSVEKWRRQGQFPANDRGECTTGVPSVRSLRAFIRGYFRGRPAALRRARRYFRRRALALELRTLFWRSDR